MRDPKRQLRPSQKHENEAAVANGGGLSRNALLDPVAAAISVATADSLMRECRPRDERKHMMSFTRVRCVVPHLLRQQAEEKET